MSEDNVQHSDTIKEYGQTSVNSREGRIKLMTVIGEIEGHECLPSGTKATKYEHILPKLAEVERDNETQGVLLLLNTVGGDVESGLAIAEMVASLSKPTVSLVLGGSHSIGVPLGCIHRSFVYCSYRNNGDSSGTYERYSDRCSPDIRLFCSDAESDFRIYCGTQSGETGTAGGTDDEYRNDGKGFGDDPGGRTGCQGGAD